MKNFNGSPMTNTEINKAIAEIKALQEEI